MKVSVTMINRHFNGHQTLIKTIQRPHWIERILTLGMMKREQVDYLGHKTKWLFYPGMKPVKSKLLIEELQALELKGDVLRGSAKNKRAGTVITLNR